MVILSNNRDLNVIMVKIVLDSPAVEVKLLKRGPAQLYNFPFFFFFFRKHHCSVILLVKFHPKYVICHS